ncbi:MAG TPA: cellulase family glycosylhydrolase [Chloroflexota bacterium]
MRRLPLLVVTGLLAMTSSLGLVEPTRAAPADALPTSGFVRVSGDRLFAGDQPLVLRGFNYYPRDYAWSAMTDWDWSEVDAELGLAEGLGANTIRVMVDYGFSTGHSGTAWSTAEVHRLDHPSPEYLAAMDQLLGVAQRHGMRVIFSLFDFMPGWAFIDQSDYAPAATYVGDLVAHFARDERIAAWDILNEGDLLPDKFPTTSMANVLGFYTTMSAAIRAADRQHLVTADFGNIERAHLSQDFVDYVSFHYYADQARLTLEIDALRGRLRRPMPVVASEVGAPSDGNPYASLSSHTVALGAYLDSALNSRALAGTLIWTLVDPNPPRTARSHQSQMDVVDFGVYDSSLHPKPSVDVVRRYFAGGCGQDQRLELRFSGARATPIPGDSRSMVIGMHQLALLGADGSALSQLTFGTLQADALDGRGWYANEDWGQWAGEAGGVAALCVVVPPEAATLSLTAHARQPGTELQVWVDGAQRGSLTLDPSTAEYRLPLS